MKDISIVIVNYNVKQLLINCLHSIYSNSNGLDVEIIVIDNDSFDGSAEAIKEQFSDINLIENKFNGGFSGANNQGIQIAKGKYIFLLNPDTEIKEDALLKLFRYMENHSNVAIAAPQLLNSDGSLQISAWKNQSVFNMILETFYLHLLFKITDYPVSFFNATFNPDTLSGAALFFDKRLIEKIGGMDEQLFWMEDIDLCYRAERQGEIVYLQDSKVMHHSGQSSKKNYNVTLSNQLLSKLKFYKKHFNILSVWLGNVFCFFLILSRIIVFTVISPFKEIWVLKAKAYRYSLNRFFRYLFLNDNSIL
jgi:GT2 family glycosyltransferase